MRGDNNLKIGDIISKLMKNPKLSEKLDNLDAIDIWEKIIGTDLQNILTDKRVHKGVLYIKLKSSVVRNELSYKKTEFIKQINQES